MFDVIGDINWLAVVLATVALTLLGGVWFGGIFAKKYAISLGNDPSKKVVMSPVGVVGPMMANLATIITSAVILQALDITSYREALLFSLIVGVGYLSAMTVNIAINPNFPRPFYYTLVNAPYFILGSVIAVSILFVF